MGGMIAQELALTHPSRVAKAIPGARLVMIPRASHIFFTDQFQAWTGALLSFLESV
jgi:pimeloyl-ACP methyl ester carboxylesterase